jgi:intein-encoded DNA endonuclease-like protein
MIGQSAGKTFAYLLGVYLGDGCVTTSGVIAPTTGRASLVFRLNTIDRDFAEATADALLALTGKRPNIREHSVKMKNAANNFAFTHACRELCEQLVADTNDKTAIPAYVFGWADDLKREFIAGLMDSEGFVTMNQHGCAYMGFKSCDVWFQDFVRILQSVGVQIGKIGVEQPRKPGYKTPRRFTIKMRSWVDSGCRFNILRKQRRVDAWTEKVSSETNMPNNPQGLKIEPELA